MQMLWKWWKFTANFWFRIKQALNISVLSDFVVKDYNKLRQDLRKDSLA